METSKILSEAFSKHLTGYALSKAILEDYAIVVAKMEGISEEQVKERIMTRTNEIFTEVVEKQKGQLDESETTTSN